MRRTLVRRVGLAASGVDRCRHRLGHRLWPCRAFGQLATLVCLEETPAALALKGHPRTLAQPSELPREHHDQDDRERQRREAADQHHRSRSDPHCSWAKTLDQPRQHCVHGRKCSPASRGHLRTLAQAKVLRQTTGGEPTRTRFPLGSTSANSRCPYSVSTGPWSRLPVVASLGIPLAFHAL